MNGKTKNWTILGGCPRSGTTGLMDSLNEDPRLGLIPEYNSNKFFKFIDSFFFKEDNISKKAWVGDINLNERSNAEVITKNFLKYVPQRELLKANLVETIYKNIFGGECEVFGEKYPRHWLIDKPDLLNHVENLKVIHISRRPSDVVRSYLYRKWLVTQGKDIWTYRDPTDGFYHWIKGWQELEKTKSLQSDNLKVFTVKYEELLDDPNQLLQIGEFLNLEHPKFKPLVKGSMRNSADLGSIDFMEKECTKVFGDLEKNWQKPIDQLLKDYPSADLIENYQNVFSLDWQDEDTRGKKKAPPKRRMLKGHLEILGHRIELNL